jgi:hypothetical protein
VDRVEAVERVGERVGLVKRKWVMRLGFEVDADDGEAGAVVSHGGAARAAEEVEQEGFCVRIANFCGGAEECGLGVRYSGGARL